MADGTQVAEEEPIEVLLGGEKKRVPELRGYKALRAGRILASISSEARQIAEDTDAFAEQYGAKHRRRITRGEARLFGRPEDGYPVMDPTAGPQDSDYIEVPAEPDDTQRFLHAFDRAFALAETQVMQAFALMLAPNDRLQELAESDDPGAVEEYLKAEGKALMFSCSWGELIDLALAAGKLVQREFAGKAEALAELGSLLPGRGSSQTQEQPQQPQEAPEDRGQPGGDPVAPEGPMEDWPADAAVPAPPEDPVELEKPSSTPPTPPPGSENDGSPLSTSSPAPTGGAAETSSGPLPGESYAASPIG